MVARPVVVRTDSAGATYGFVDRCQARHVGFAVVARPNKRVAAATSRTFTQTVSRWLPARRQNGEVRDGAQAAELTNLVDLSDWPSGTRLIVRREPLHPGAQQSVFPSTSFRLWGTTRPGRRPRHPRRHHPRPRPCRGPHPPPQGLRAVPLPVARPRRQPGLPRCRVLRRRSRPLVPAALPHKASYPRRAPRRCGGGSGTPRPAHPHARRDIVHILDGWPDAEAIVAAHDASPPGVRRFRLGNLLPEPSQSGPRNGDSHGHWRITRERPDQRIFADQGLFPAAPSAGFEPAHTAPEADALSPELRGRDEQA
jgi:hypothetical protein